MRACVKLYHLETLNKPTGTQGRRRGSKRYQSKTAEAAKRHEFWSVMETSAQKEA